MSEPGARRADAPPSATPLPPGYALQRQDGCLQLFAPAASGFAPLSLDWHSAEQRRRIAAGRRQLIARAVGLAKKPRLHVIDATAGLGRDGYTLAALGARVTLIERSPVVAALLRDAHARASAAGDPVPARITIVEADAIAWLREGGAEGADAIYVDPMYPETNKRALPQRAMQMLRELCGIDPDAEALVSAARQSPVRRVVVKRPPKGAFAGAAPDLVMRGTQARFDVYLKPQV